MDNFSSLKWSERPIGNTGSSSASSSRNSTKPPTPVPTSGNGSAFDSFASLTPMGTGSNKPKKLEVMSLHERQKMLKNESLNSNTVKSNSDTAWSGLDLLAGTIGSSEKGGIGSAVKSGSNGVPSGSLLDGFPELKNTDVNLDDEKKEEEKDNIDDLFAVFNRPKEVPKVVPEIKQEDISTDSEDNGYDTGTRRNHRPPPKDSRLTPASKGVASSSSSSSSLSSSSFSSASRPPPPRIDPRDEAIAELVDMGFSDEQARYSLAQTDNGLDVRQAVDVLMNEAHRRATNNGREQSTYDEDNSEWERERERHYYRTSGSGSGSDGSGGVNTQEIGKLAQELSTQFISKAGTLWNQSRKNFAKAIEQYNHTHSSSSGVSHDTVPAWMRDAERYNQGGRATGRGGSSSEPLPPPSIRLDRDMANSFTDEFNDDEDNSGYDSSSSNREEKPTPEALMLESDRGPRIRRQQQQKSALSRADTGPTSYSPHLAHPQPDRPHHPRQGPLPPDNVSQTATATPPPPPLSRSQLLRQRQKERLAEEDVMYVSSSRRRTPTPNLGQSSRPQTPQPQLISRTATPAVKKPSIPPREPVGISDTALTMSNTAREAGTEAFKRGDFTDALTHYSQALKSIPPKHLLRTIVLTNRSTCYLKCGDAKSALADAEQAITIIGPGLGAGEEAEPGKPLKDIWAKAVSRKAEACEHLEKFQDALDSWSLVISNGYSSKPSLDGKRRCQEALTPTPKSKPSTPKPGFNGGGQSSSSSGGPQSAAGKAAVQKIKDANKVAEEVDSERYALHDTVNVKIESWRHGKEENLRALLSSLDSILWVESGWKKVSLADLVIDRKVKIIYMKAVAKTHPDKISTTATTEQKMIAEGVFITLNKAWDQFKVANGLS